MLRLLCIPSWFALHLDLRRIEEKKIVLTLNEYVEYGSTFYTYALGTYCLSAWTPIPIEGSGELSYAEAGSWRLCIIGDDSA